MDLSFYPNGNRAKQLDKRMHRELLRSIKLLCQQISSQRSSSETETIIEKLSYAADSINAKKRLSPSVFASYYQLVFALLNEEHHLDKHIDHLLKNIKEIETLVFHDFSVEGLGSDEQVALYESCFNTDENINFQFIPPSKKASASTMGSINRALSLMGKIVPEMANEFKSIIIEIILAAGPKDPNAMRFDGASSYMLWGALVLSVDDEKSDLEMLETLAHESAHSFLFGLTIEEPLTLNESDKLYNSPLRIDPRPMDGIYHATYVSARMHFAINEVLNSNQLKNKEHRDECSKLLKASKKAFYDGYGTVEKQGQLSRSGQNIMQNAYNYMENYSFKA